MMNTASDPKPLHIWQVGNWCAHWGNEFRESAFRSSIKDFEVLNFMKREHYDRFWAQVFAPGQTLWP